MQVTKASVHTNLEYEDTASESVKSLNLSCRLIWENPQTSDIPESNEVEDISDVQEEEKTPEEKTPEEKAAEESAAHMKELVMSAMVAQYRIEALLGGDPDDEANPVHVPEW